MRLDKVFSKKNEPSLKKFYFLIFLTIAICLSLQWFNCPEANALDDKGSIQDDVSIIIKPERVMIGDTVVVKVARSTDTKESPKIYFDKTKIPVFVLDDKWFRGLIPVSASTKAGKYQLEVFYKNKEKKLDLNIAETKYPLENLTLSKEVAALNASKIEKSLVAQALNSESSNKLWSSKFIFPSSGRKSTVYGVKRKINGSLDPDYFHKGLDFAASTGSNVIAPENGKVILAGYQPKGFVVNGNCIFLDHGQGVITAYLHLSEISTKEGDFIKKGQIIGKVGSSGIASGPHLHWGLYVHGMTVDPLVWTSQIIE